MQTIRQFREFALDVAPAAAAVANYCDHVEHNEAADIEWVVDAADNLRRYAVEFATAAKVDLIETYAERLGAIEAKNVYARPGSYDGHGGALAATTWRELQIVQMEHDRYYHADVIGLPKVEQLRHYALHLAKIVGAFAGSDDSREILTRRLPDTLLFGIKLRTVMGRRLPDEMLPEAAKFVATTAAG